MRASTERLFHDAFCISLDDALRRRILKFFEELEDDRPALKIKAQSETIKSLTERLGDTENDLLVAKLAFKERVEALTAINRQQARCLDSMRFDLSEDDSRTREMKAALKAIRKITKEFK